MLIFATVSCGIIQHSGQILNPSQGKKTAIQKIRKKKNCDDSESQSSVFKTGLLELSVVLCGTGTYA